MKEKKVPAIRFQEFTDNWEQRKLGDKMYIKSRIGWQRLTKDEYLSSGEYYLITGTDIDEYTHTIDLKHSYYVSKDRYDKDSNIQVHNGDIIVTKDGTIGKVAMVCNLDKPATLNSHLFVLRDMSGKIYNRFLLQFLTSDLFTRFVDATKTGSTLTGMPQKIFVKFQYMLPSFSEQKKVAYMLDGIDNIIAIHQRKLTKLQLLKKSMLTKMFPKDGARVPEIRFQGFHGDWVQHQFGDVGSVAMCKRIFKDETSDKGDIPFFKIGTFGGDPDAYIGRELFDEYKSKYPYPEIGDILLSASGTIGRQVEYKGEDAYYQDSNIIWLKHSKVISNKFLKVVYQVIKWNGIEGSTIKRLYNDNILKTKFFLPSLKEQEAIGDYFYNLDALISLQKDRFNKLKQIKQAMLSKLFV